MITGRCLPGDSVVERGKQEHRPERGALGIGGERLEIPAQAAGLAQRADVGVEGDRVGVIVVKAVVQGRQAESTGQENEKQLNPPRIPPAAAIPRFCVRATATREFPTLLR